MADLVKKIRTSSGDLQIDYNALANRPKYLNAGVAHVEEKSTTGTRYSKIIDVQCESAYHRICQSMILTSRIEAMILTIVVGANGNKKFDSYNVYYTPLTPTCDGILNSLSAGIVNISGGESNKFELWYSQGQYGSSINIAPLSKNYEGNNVNFYTYDATSANQSTAPSFDQTINLINSHGG